MTSRRKHKLMKRLATMTLTGSMLFQFTSCDGDTVKVQAARGFTTVIGGLVDVLAQDLANVLFNIEE